MKLSLIAAALVALTLTACDRPKQALPENSTSYGTRLEEGTTLNEERGDKYKEPVGKTAIWQFSQHQKCF